MRLFGGPWARHRFAGWFGYPHLCVVCGRRKWRHFLR